MPASTLVGITQRHLIRHLSSLQDVGDTPYELVKPVLRKLVDPQQLRNIEIASPHIADADAELWLNFIKRDVPNWKEKIVTPTNPRSWWKVYRKLYKEEKAAQEEQQKQLREAMQAQQKEKEEHQPNFLNTVVQQKFKHQKMLDGVPNPKYGSYGFERAGTVASAKKNGKNIISAIRKASTKPAHFKPSASQPQSEQTQPRMWQTPIIPPGTRRKGAPNLLSKSPAKILQRTTKLALDRALREDEKIKEEKAKRASNSPPPLTAANLAVHAQSPAKTQPAQPVTVPAAISPPRTAFPAVAGKTGTPLGAGAGTKRPHGPEKPSAVSPAPPQKRQRPAQSIFMPSKRIKR